MKVLKSFAVNQGLANDGPWAKVCKWASCLFLWIKFTWNTATLICSLSVYGHNGRAEDLWQRPYGSQSRKYLLSGPFGRRVHTPVPNIQQYWLYTHHNLSGQASWGSVKRNISPKYHPGFWLLIHLFIRMLNTNAIPNRYNAYPPNVNQM